MTCDISQHAIGDTETITFSACVDETVDIEQIRLFEISFKAGRRDFYYLDRASTLDVQMGNLVIVEADRGQDLGKVASEVPDQDIPLIYINQRNPKLLLQHKRIVRHADLPEITTLISKSREECQAVMVTNTIVQSYNLSIVVVDAEFQWDRLKLTLFFEAENRVDFRELVRGLFKIYHVRIMMRRIKEGTRSTLPYVAAEIDSISNMAEPISESQALLANGVFAPWAPSNTWSIPKSIESLPKFRSDHKPLYNYA